MKTHQKLVASTERIVETARDIRASIPDSAVSFSNEKKDSNILSKSHILNNHQSRKKFHEAKDASVLDRRGTSPVDTQYERYERTYGQSSSYSGTQKIKLEENRLADMVSDKGVIFSQIQDHN